MFMTPLTEFEYYWEKAEFQDPVSHRAHVENYKKGIRDSIAFDAQYQKEAEEELEKENEKWSRLLSFVCVCFWLFGIRLLVYFEHAIN